MRIKSFTRRHWPGLLLVALATVLLLWIFPSREPAPLPEGVLESRPSAVAPLPTRTTPSNRETVQKKVQERGRVQESPRLPEISRNLPDLKTYREEVRANPHSTPPSLLHLADVLAEHRMNVKAHPEKAEEMMKELQDCVSKLGEVPSAQALCLTNAEQLVKESLKDSSLQEKLQEELRRMREMASPEARTIVQRISQL